MSPKGRVAASSTRRRRILNAGLELFLEAGVGNCRTEDLFARSGASVGSFYHHFGGKPELAAALHLEILGEFQRDFLAELARHRSAQAGITAVIGHHLRWVTGEPRRAAYLFQCLEPEVFEACREEQNRVTTAFLAACIQWLDERAAAGEIRRLTPLEYYALWLGPTLELTRAWLMNVQKKWVWMNAEQVSAQGLLGAETVLADAAWQALRVRE